MAARRCPVCNLVNPGSAMACDCGYSFADGYVKQSYLTPKQQVERVGGMDQAGNRIALRIIRIVIIAVVMTAVKMCMLHR